MNFQNLNPTEFKAAIRNNKNAVILDVRTPAEIAAGKIDKAIEIDFFDNNFAEKALALDKSKDYYIYCRSGNRSGQACALMAANGFSNLVNLDGGMMAWEMVNS